MRNLVIKNVPKQGSILYYYDKEELHLQTDFVTKLLLTNHKIFSTHIFLKPVNNILSVDIISIVTNSFIY